ncbi:MAG TPA: serine/threonine-protein kinase [Acidobacteriota bacterium]|nr:serine/threonine-protein kinase [Acidobacteriota bacterium]
MSRERELFEACLDLPAQERESYLEEKCAGDGVIKEKVRRLLAAHEDSLATDAFPELPLAQEMEEIGPYRILGILGEGGMGVVYEAEQQEPVRRRVALKVIRVGMQKSSPIVRRFEAERQALAVMDHPYIAKVLDAGVTSDGRPYFVMELVEGIPVDEFCDRHSLTTRRRLELFMRICRAVQHAHQKGIIHRDLKPSNVLVSKHGEEIIPRVIDFGIAKAMGESLTDQTLVTHHGITLGTPAYMSPEQAGQKGLDIDTRSDIYSLGVMLYEVLVGRLPLDPSELGVPAFVAKLASRQTEPPTPSARWRQLGDQQTQIAQRRRTDPWTLERQLKGDLDWIVMKALEADRDRRYETVDALSKDLNRYLTNQPVLARPPSRSYRLSKFVRRNRSAVAAALVAVLAVLAGLAGTTVGLIRATQAEAQARRQAATAEHVTDFLVGLFEVSDPGQSRGESVTAKELLAQGAARIESELQDDPLVRARLLKTLGRVHLTLGLYEEAQSLASRAVEIEGAADADPLELAESLSIQAAAHSSLGEFETAEQMLQEAAAIRRKELGLEHRLIADSRHALGVLYWRLDRLEEARQMHESNLELRRRLLGTDHLDVGHSHRSLALVLFDMGEHEQARQGLERSLQIFRRELGDNHPLVSDSLDSLGLVEHQLGHFEKAHEFYLQALQLRKETLGEEHPTLAFSHLNLARAASALNRPEEALRHYRQGLRIREEQLGPDHPRTADLLESLAVFHARRGEFQQARPLFERSLDIYVESYGPEHRETLESFRNLAVLDALQGRTEEAVDLLWRAYRGGYAAKLHLDQSLFDPLRDHPRFKELTQAVQRQLQSPGLQSQ